jgi:hypothetical protein
VPIRRLAVAVILMTVLLWGSGLPVQARSNFSPWSPEMSFQNLVYGASSPWDVQQVLGAAPDEVLRVEQMYPVIENHVYYEEGGTGAATIFVFENNLLVGLTYKSPTNQYMDLTYFLPSNGDNVLNYQLQNHAFRRYFPGYGLYRVR